MALGLTKQYLRYASSALFGVVASNKGNISFVEQRGIKGKYVAVPACEHVFIWDVKKAEKVSLPGHTGFDASLKCKLRTGCVKNKKPGCTVVDVNMY